MGLLELVNDLLLDRQLIGIAPGHVADGNLAGVLVRTAG